jgi:hypothetical protein
LASVRAVASRGGKMLDLFALERAYPCLTNRHSDLLPEYLRTSSAFPPSTSISHPQDIRCPVSILATIILHSVCQLSIDLRLFVKYDGNSFGLAQTPVAFSCSRPLYFLVRRKRALACPEECRGRDAPGLFHRC